jgi:hypothetical protein
MRLALLRCEYAMGHCDRIENSSPRSTTRDRQRDPTDRCLGIGELDRIWEVSRPRPCFPHSAAAALSWRRRRSSPRSLGSSPPASAMTRAGVCATSTHALATVLVIVRREQASGDPLPGRPSRLGHHRGTACSSARTVAWPPPSSSRLPGGRLDDADVGGSTPTRCSGGCAVQRARRPRSLDSRDIFVAGGRRAGAVVRPGW